MRALALVVLLAGTALAAGKPKVVVDAPAPLKALLTSALKKKFTAVRAKQELSPAPTASEVKQAVREAGAIAVVTARVNDGVWTVMVLNGADGSPLEQFRFNGATAKKSLKALPKGSDARLALALKEAHAPRREESKKKEEPPPEEGKAQEEGQVPEEKEAPKEAPKKSQPASKLEHKEEPVKKAESKQRPTPKVIVVEPVETKREEEPAEASDQEPKPTALWLGAGGRVFSRRFFYKDDIFSALSKYSLAAGPAIVVEADWFPGAHVTSGPGAHVGLSVGLNYAVGISSVASNGTRYGTSALRLRVGALGRITFGRIELQPLGGFVLQTYSITGGAGGASRPNIPDVSYNIARFGLGSRINVIGPVFITAGIAYDAPLSTGEIGSKAYFPRLTVAGFDANLGLAVKLGANVEIHGGIDYTRYWYSMNPDPADNGGMPYVAGGALDDYKGANLTVCFTL